MSRLCECLCWQHNVGEKGQLKGALNLFNISPVHQDATKPISYSLLSDLVLPLKAMCPTLSLLHMKGSPFDRSGTLSAHVCFLDER